MKNRDRIIEALKCETEEQREYVHEHICCPYSYEELYDDGKGFCELNQAEFEKNTRGSCIECKVDWLMQEEAKKKELLSDEQLAFIKGLDHAEEVLEEYFDLVQNAWSGCAEEYKRSAKILKNGAIRWVHGAQFQKAAEFLEGAEVE